MLVLLPLLTLLGIIYLIKFQDIRLRILTGLTLTGVLVVIFTEGLSLFHAFTQVGLAAAWGCCVLVVGVLSTIRLRRIGFHLTLPHWNLSLLEKLLLMGCAGLVLFTGVIALVAAPNNWDSMAYHLARVVHWQQNGSVAFYPTNNLFQDFQAPWAEYAVGTVHILSRGDRFDNLIQWAMAIIAAIGISWIAGRLGARRSSQILAALVTFTLPLVILESTTTQNDLTTSAWVIVFIVFALAWMQKNYWEIAVTCGTALGLAMLTKATAYFHAIFFLLWLVIAVFVKYRRAAIKGLLLAGLVAALLNSPYWLRNLQLFHSPLGPQDVAATMQNQPFSPQALVLNSIRNVLTNTQLPAALAESATQKLKIGLQRVNIDLNDPRFTFPDDLFSIPSLRISEDQTGNFLHMLLLILAGISFMIHPPKQNTVWLFMLVLIATALFFSAYLRWQFYQSRLLLPGFMLGIPLIALAIDQYSRPASWGIAALLLLGAVPFFLFNPTKPLIQDYNIFNLPRREVMLRRKDILVQYITAVDELNKNPTCGQIGLVTFQHDWEYPFWNLLQDTDIHPLRIEHVLVENPSASVKMLPFAPCALVVTRPGVADRVMTNGIMFQRGWQMAPVSLYYPVQ